ncbi:thioredoxin family protein [Ferrimonas aestuarii]|uniref:Thioredoxin family protein n=2 Tax=Ferrimonas aestuarii TaxID=2569539 RepID=A0A4U1BU38_9GAMM|nr:thioredoxin family protein [Ferrimonas aestuarii]
MKVEVLGSGCKKCTNLAANIQAVADAMGKTIDLEKVTDMGRILEYSVMSTPAIVIDGQVKTSGTVPNDAEIQALLS